MNDNDAEMDIIIKLPIINTRLLFSPSRTAATASNTACRTPGRDATSVTRKPATQPRRKGSTSCTSPTAARRRCSTTPTIRGISPGWCIRSLRYLRIPPRALLEVPSHLILQRVLGSPLHRRSKIHLITPPRRRRRRLLPRSSTNLGISIPGFACGQSPSQRLSDFLIL